MRDWGWIEAVVGAVTLVIGAWAKSLVDLVRARNEGRQLDHQAAATTSDAERELREELRAEVRELRDLIEAQAGRLTELGEERLGLKRALDKRDFEIEMLQLRLSDLERISAEHAECPARIAELQRRVNELQAQQTRLQEVSDVQTP